MSIRVDHVMRFSKKEGEVAIYVGRKNPSIPDNITQLNELGNPFPISSSRDRHTVVSMYNVWLRNAIEDKKHVQNAMRLILEAHKTNDVVLLCWCHPKECHADKIRDIVLEAEKLEKKLDMMAEAEAAMDRTTEYGATDYEIDDKIWREQDNF